jgi:oleate hydratase
MNAYLVGGGLASLAAAAYLIKDGGFSGDNITIYEATEHLGGCLYSASRPEIGFAFIGRH